MSQRISKTEGIAIARLVIAKVGLVEFLTAGISAIGATRLSAVLAGRDPGITLADAPAILAALDGLITSKEAVEIVASVIGLQRTADLLADLEAVLATPADATRAWSRADSRIEAVMVTPLFVMRDAATVAAQCRQIAASSRFNSVVSLVDLQSGRDYIAPGRTATDLTQLAKDNLRLVLDAGLTPILIIRNDWAVRTKTGQIPSGNPATATDFYSAARLEQEKTFLNNLRGWFPFIHLQLSIEPEVNASAPFALALARHLRSIGFANRILVNPIGNASGAHDKIATDLAAAGVTFARSRNGTDLGRDPVINTDGNTAITAANFDRDWWPRLAADGREYIVWSKELANSPSALPAGYFGTSATPGLTGSEEFLWKPISENTKKLVVLIPASISDKAATLTVNGERLPFASIANGNRAHFRSGKPGSAYGSNIDVTYVTPDGRRYAWRIPNGGSRYTSTVPSGSAPPPTPQPEPPKADDQFRYEPIGNSIRITIPADHKPWQLHIFSLRKHHILAGPIRHNGPVYTIPMTGEQIRDAAISAEGSPAIMAYVNTNTPIDGGGRQAGWRIYDPTKPVIGDATKLKTGENK